ncbi:MAG: TonB-dependent receptor [Spirochaetia bacterium]|nr:TonB-dependent receptor [Spirochaetia bacterium]
MHRIACLVVSAMFMAGGAFAQGADGLERLDLGQAIVTGTVWAPSNLSPTAATVVLDRAAIEESGARNLAELVDQVAGVEVLENGYAGSVQTAKVRGGSGGHVVVVVDGVRLNDARTGSVDLSSIPLAGVERVELLRSGASALYGSDAIAGVVYVTTARTGESGFHFDVSTTAYPRAYAEGQAAVLAAQSLSAGLKAGLGAVTLSASGGLERAADTLPVASDAAGTSGYELVQNAGLLGGYVDLGAVGSVFGGIGKASVFGRSAEKGVPGRLASPTVNANQSEQEARVAASWGTDALADGAVSLSGDVNGTWARLHFEDPDEWPSGTDATHDSLGVEANLRSELLVGKAIVRTGVSGSVNTAASSVIGDRERFFAGAYVVPELAVGSLTLAPSLRYDVYSDFAAGLSYGLGAAWSTGGLKLSVNAASAYKAPSFNDLYWPADAYIQGNPDLEAERGWSTEFGADFASVLGGVELALNASPYFRYVESMINWADNGSGIWTPTNIDKAAYLGADVAASLHAGPAFSSLSYSYTLARNLSDGSEFAEADRLAYVPIHAISVKAGARIGIVKASVNADYRMGLLASSFSGNYELPDLLLVGLSAEAEALPGTFLGINVDNLLDEAYVENDGYPMPGLSVTASLRLVQ